MTTVVLHAPMSGWAAPLDEVPDPVFAERMMGQGLAIDPLEGMLRAPCDAEVIALPSSRHAITLRLTNGAELLIHIGLETVGLAGEGFAAHVEAGRRVRQGDLLISFDLDAVAGKAKSLISPIVLTGEDHEIVLLAVDRLVAAGEPIASVAGERRAQPDPKAAEPGCTTKVVIRAAHGIHARPAARIAAAAKPFAAAVELGWKGKRANARSPVALMTLGLQPGDRATLTGCGEDADAAVAAVAAAIERLADDELEPQPAATAPAARAAAGGLLNGVCAAPGLAVGPVVRFTPAELRVESQGRGVEAERGALAAARATVAARLAAIEGADDGISEAHRSLLDDPEIVTAAEAEIAAGRSAGFAWRAAIDATAAMLRGTGNPLLVERIDDLRDVERQVLAELQGEREATPPELPTGAILVADNLLVSQWKALDVDRLGGICTARGGPTSHVAILAASAGMPMLVAVGERLAALADGSTVVLDASGGAIDPAPDARALAAATDRLARQRQSRAAQAAAAAEDCRMADGTRIEVFANLASAQEARRAVEAGAEGCGLLRTEFLFHDRADAPSEEEQRTVYARLARALGGRPLIIRTLDAGGDKPAPYLAMPQEENPALGLRGVRLSLSRPELLATQLRAILGAGPAGDIRVMVPMIVDIVELRAVRAALEKAAAALGVAAVPLGVMIETPAAALLAGSLAAEADFLSVGTNDLSQYALAADRGNPATAARIDALHPAVLRLVAAAADGARTHGKCLGICGGIASDPLASAILIGLGATELSATPAAIPALKAAVRRLRLDECRLLSARALEAEGSEAVRALAATALTTDLRGAA